MVLLLYNAWCHIGKDIISVPWVLSIYIYIYTHTLNEDSRIRWLLLGSYKDLNVRQSSSFEHEIIVVLGAVSIVIERYSCEHFYTVGTPCILLYTMQHCRVSSSWN